MRTIEIRGVLNGYVAQVGCQTLVFTTRAALLHSLDAYLTNPEETEKQFLANAVNPMGVPVAPPQPTDAAPQEYLGNGAQLSQAYTRR